MEEGARSFSRVLRAEGEETGAKIGGVNGRRDLLVLPKVSL